MAKLKKAPTEGPETAGVLAYEEMVAKTYFIRQEVKAYANAGNHPGFSALIHMRGKPSRTGASATSAEIHFYPDGDNRIVAPSYDEHLKRINLYVPLSLLREYMATVSGKGDVMCGYFETNVGPWHNGYLQRLETR